MKVCDAFYVYSVSFFLVIMSINFNIQEKYQGEKIIIKARVAKISPYCGKELFTVTTNNDTMITHKIQKNFPISPMRFT